VSEAVDTVGKKEVSEPESKGVGGFVRDVRSELERVSFPSWDDVRGTTLIVIINVIFFAIFLFLVDQAWVYLLMGIEWLVNKAAGI
jgi:preprotein translocase subunit SecE